MKKITKSIISIMTILGIVISPILSSAKIIDNYPMNATYYKIGDEVFGNSQDEVNVYQTDWRGWLQLTETQNQEVTSNGFSLDSRISKTPYVEYGQFTIARFNNNSNSNYVDTIFFRGTGNTGGNSIDVSTEVISEDLDIEKLESILGNGDALGLRKTLNINDFKNKNDYTLQKLESFLVTSKETREMEYIITLTTNDGNIEKYAFCKELEPISPHEEKEPGEEIVVTTTFTPRSSYWEFEDVVLDYAETLPGLPIAYYRTSIDFLGSRHSKTFNGWYYDNRHHEYPFNPKKPITRDTDLYISMNMGLRLEGKSRYQTADMVAKRFWQTDKVILVNGDIFADALSASTLGSVNDAPILLTKTDSLDDEVLQTIEDLEVKEVYIVGSTGSVSSAIENQLQNLSLKTTRIGGKDRYETSSLVAKNILQNNNDVEDICFVDGTNYPDGLSASNIGNKYGAPILLTDPEHLNPDANNIISENNIKNAYIVGGEGSVSREVENNIDIPTTRFSGSNRYDTSLAVLEKALFNNHCIIMVSGDNFADALVGGPYAGLQGGSLLLTNNNSPKNKNVINFLKKYQIHEGVIIGGSSWISYATEDKMISIGNEDTVNTMLAPYKRMNMDSAIINE